jgi:membrane fusion protein (multidrug efflux system)
MKVSLLPVCLLALIPMSLTSCAKHDEEHHEEAHKVTATTPVSQDVTITQQYVCQIHSQRHIDLRVLERGYLQKIDVKEGQTVKAGDELFAVMPNIYQAKLDAENAEAKLAELELQNTRQLAEKGGVSQREVLLFEAKALKAKSNAKLAAAEMAFTKIVAPFDGIIDRLHHQQGSLVEEGEMLTTLSDNSLMWVYFNMPEAGYLDYKNNLEKHKDDLKIELVLADHAKFNQKGKIGAIEADFNNTMGTIAFRADFPNPDSLLRHGQTGTILLKRTLKDALVIPQRSTFETLAKRYVYVLDNDSVAHQREITYSNELDDLFVITDGLTANDKIVLEGVRQIRDGDKVEYEEQKPHEVMAQLKYKAE